MPLFIDRVNVKSVCLLLGLCHAGSAAALGLGEINVRSYLGQPLNATVTLLGVTPNTAADCFSLGTSAGSIAPPLRAQLSVERSGGQTLLRIRTPQPIHDPIAQFVLVSDCEARLQRDYVVLLDPPAQVEPAVGHETPAAVRPVAAPPPRAVRPARRVKRAPAEATRPHAMPPHSRTAPAVAEPRLILSGRRSVSRTADALFALRLDTNLPDMTQPRPESLTATEMSDENTALTRKLAYLETQLTALHQRNAELEAKRAAVAPSAPPPSRRPAHWPLYLLAIGLIGVGGTLAVWLRRRSRSSARQDDAPWTHPDALPALSKMERIAEPPLSPPPEHMPEIPQPPHEEDSGTEVKEDILDQAEVFMAFGHGDLAIHLLQEHLREAPAESPVPWLLLLDLLHREGDTVGYAAASAECRRYFNVNLNSYPISQDGDSGKGLEAYPHVLEQLLKAWQSPDIDAFFSDLIYDNRGGTRMGFEPGAYRDILLLRAIAQDAQPLALVG